MATAGLRAPCKRAFSVALVVLVGLCLAGAPASGQTSRDRAVEFLANAQDPRGSWGEWRDETSLRDTTAALRALVAVGHQSSSAYQAGLAWLANEARRNTDDAARASEVLSGTALDFAAQDDRAALRLARIGGQGWGLGLADTQLSPLDTALATNALRDELTYAELWRIFAALHLARNPDAGWGVGGDSLVSITARVALTLARGEYAVPEVAETLDEAIAYLASAQDVDGRIGGGPLETALAAQALTASGRMTGTAVADAIAYLHATQLDDGSWGGDPYATAEAILALRAVGPNLTAGPSGATFTPPFPREGDSLTIEIDLANVGAQAAGGFAVRVYRGAPAAGYQVGGDLIVAGLAAGATATVSVAAELAGVAGGQTFTVVIDPANAVAEANESDNERAFWVSVEPRPKPDLIMTLNDIRFSPARTTEDRPIDISARVRNGGGVDASNVMVAFYDGNPQSGGALLDSRLIPGIAAEGDATVTVEGLSFPRGVHFIWVVVDEDDSIAEASELNNLSLRPLLVTEDVDLVVQASGLELRPGNQVRQGEPVLLSAVVTNTGAVPAYDVVMRLEETGELVHLGALEPGASGAALFSIDTSALAGLETFDVVADPGLQVFETDEDNNRASITLDVLPKNDLYVGPLSLAAVIDVHDMVTFTMSVRNAGDATEKNVRVSALDGPPGAGARITPDLVLSSVPGGLAGLSGEATAGWGFAASALGVGVHDIYFIVDPDDTIDESNETNNVRIHRIDVRPRPDLAIRPEDVTITPASVEVGDTVNVTATVRNLEPTTRYSTVHSQWIAQLFDGGAGSGTLLAQVDVDRFSATGSYTLTAQIDTTGRQGSLPVTFLADPEGNIPDQDRSNNHLTINLDVGTSVTPNLAVTREDIVSEPASFTAGTSVEVRATIRNTREAVPGDPVGVALYLGDPEAGGVLLHRGDVSFASAREATVSALWDTTGMSPGDAGIFVVVDGDGAVAETDETDNRVARGFEIRLDDSHRPLDFEAVADGAGASLAWIAPPSPATAIAGYSPLRDGVPIEELPTGWAGRIAATATANAGNAHRAIDDRWNTNWSVGSAAMPAALDIELNAKRWVREVGIRSNRRPLYDYDLQAWDGAAWVTQVEVRGNDIPFETPWMTLPRPVKTDRLRVRVLRAAPGETAVDVGEVWVRIAPLLSATAAVDGDLRASAYRFGLTAVNAAGIATVPVEQTLALDAVPAPAPVTAAVDGNSVQLSWPPDDTGRRTGVYVFRDGALVGAGTGTLRVNTTASFEGEPASPLRPASHAGDLTAETVYRPPAGAPPPWIATALLPEPRPIQQVMLRYLYLTPRPFGVTIEAWADGQWVRCGGLSGEVQTGSNQWISFAPVMTDRVRVITHAADGGPPQLDAMNIYAVAPLPPDDTTFEEGSLPIGSYHYEVVAVDALGQDGPAAAVVAIGALPAPGSLTATVIGRDVQLDWDASAASNLVGYRIYRDGEPLATIGAGATASFVDTALPDGTFAYQVAAIDQGGSDGELSAPAEATIGSAERIVDLVGSISPEGIASLSWSDALGAAGYHLYVRGARVTGDPVAATTITHEVNASGAYAFEVTAVSDEGFETARSNPVELHYEDITPPGPPSSLRADGAPWRIRWDASPASDDVVGYNVRRIDGPTRAVAMATLQADTSYQQSGSTFGLPVYHWQVTAVDVSGLESEPASLSLPLLPEPLQPSATSATANENAVTLHPGPVTGHTPRFGFKRDGAIVRYTSQALQAVSASSGTATLDGAVNTPNAAYADDEAWHADASDAQPWLTVWDGGGLFEIDRVKLSWLSENQMARSFALFAELYDGSEIPILERADNQQVSAWHTVQPVVARRLTLRVWEKAHADRNVGVYDLRVQSFEADASPPLVDSAAPPGEHEYRVFFADRAGRRSPDSQPIAVSLADIDLVVGTTDIRFSEDAVNVGDPVDVIVSVRNLGTADLSGAADVELFLGAPEAGGVALGARTFAGLAAGARVDVTFPVTVTFSPESLHAIVDRGDAVDEIAEDNNRAARGYPITLPHRSYTFSMGDLTIYSYEDASDFIVRDQVSGQTVWAGTLQRGQRKYLPTSAGVFHVSGGNKFSLYAGYHDVVGHHALDKEGSALSTEFYTSLGVWQRGYEHIIAWAVEDDTSVTVTDADTNEVLAQETINRGERVHVRDLAEWLRPRFVRIVASRPVTALSTSDQGYAAADMRGRFAGREFFTFAQPKGGSFSTDGPSSTPGCRYATNIYAYQDDTFVRMVDTSLGEELLAVVLREGESTYRCFPSGSLNWLHVEASNDVSVSHRTYRQVGLNENDESGTASDSTGTGIGTRLLDLMQPKINDRTSQYGYIFAYYDNTEVTVRELERADGTAPHGIVRQTLLDDGEFIDIGLHGDPVGDVPGRLIEVSTNRPVSGRFGGGSFSGDFMPVLFGGGLAPDLEISAQDIAWTSETPQPGDLVRIAATVRNAGVRAAQAFPVDIYDGDPSAGGELLHRELVDHLVGIDERVVSVDFELTEGFHDIYVLVDADALVDELDETNNVAHRLFSTSPDAVASIGGLMPAEPLVNETVRVDVVVANAGGAHLERVDVQLYDGDPETGGIELASDSISLMAGEARTLAMTWDTHGVLPGPRTLYVVADGAEQIAEANEDNNVAFADLTLLAPDYDDLALADVTFVPSSPFAGTPALARVTVENRGRPLAGASVRLYLDDVVVADDVIPFALDTAARHELAIPLTVDPPGAHLLLAVADPEDHVVELDEANNAFTLPIDVRDPAMDLLMAASPSVAGAGAQVAVALQVVNRAQAREGALDLVVRDGAGGIIATLADAEPLAFAAAETASVAYTWNTEDAVPADYVLEASYREGEDVIAVAATVVTVTPETGVTVLVNADRAAYEPGQDVVVSTYVAGDPGGNAVLEDVAVVTEVVAPDGATVVFSESQSVDLAPGGELELFSTWSSAV